MKKHKPRKLSYIIINHLKNNIREYTIICLCFIIGIIIGIFFVNHIEETQRNEATAYIDTFINTIKNSKQINYLGLLKDSILKNITLAGILWFLGITITLVPLIYGVICFRGFCLGYTISSVIAALGLNQGLTFAITILLLQNLVIIPVMFAIAQSGIQINKRILKKNEDGRIRHGKENVKLEILRHTIFSVLMSGILIISSFIETYISTNLFVLTLDFI